MTKSFMTYFSIFSGIEFSYMESPRFIHGVITGMFFAIIAFSDMVASYFTFDTNTDKHWPTENYFFILVLLLVVNFLVFIPVALKYRYLSAPFLVQRYENRQAQHIP